MTRAGYHLRWSQSLIYMSAGEGAPMRPPIHTKADPTSGGGVPSIFAAACSAACSMASLFVRRRRRCQLIVHLGSRPTRIL